MKQSNYFISPFCSKTQKFVETIEKVHFFQKLNTIFAKDYQSEQEMRLKLSATSIGCLE